ncbi:MAG: type I-F CRISPR-associated endoribonuclease Cas6/Csy4, partial [Desulfamplus sp.]|nr:type I-F CRISPR-associated endoribonuclease Cas6/Csy4 [Desulfamplus sp.]
MKHYIELTLIQNADIAHYFLWEKVFQQVHLGLVEMQDSDKKVQIGISFPEYDKENYRLGNKIRFFAEDEATLKQFDVQKWLNRLLDYVHLTRIRPVPDRKLTYACYKREQIKETKERLARRKAKRAGISIDEALQLLGNYEEKRVRTPFINIKSQSSDRRFRLFILKENSSELINQGFSSYGLSNISTVPEF